MSEILKAQLRKINENDISYFNKWWRDEDLIKLTSGDFTSISNDEINQYFSDLLNNLDNYQFMIDVGAETIGHISLSKRTDSWHELQIIIGAKNEWNKGYGSDAANLAINFAKKIFITKIYLEVRPTNIRAIKSYEKCGFKQIKIFKYPDNSNLPETLRMELNII